MKKVTSLLLLGLIPILLEGLYGLLVGVAYPLVEIITILFLWTTFPAYIYYYKVSRDLTISERIVLSVAAIIGGLVFIITLTVGAIGVWHIYLPSESLGSLMRVYGLQAGFDFFDYTRDFFIWISTVGALLVRILIINRDLLLKVVGSLKKTK